METHSIKSGAGFSIRSTSANMLRTTVFLMLVIVVLAKNNFYTVKWERIDVINYDYDIVNVTGSCKFINRTTKGLNLILAFKQPLVESNVIYVLANKWINNNWVRYSSIQFTENVKSLLKMEWFDLQSLFKENAKPPLVWPWQAVTYTVKDYVLDADNFPVYIPTGLYKADVIFFDTRKKEKQIFQLNWYLNLLPLNKYGKN